MQVQSDLSYRVIGAAIEVHKVIGPGLLESIYEECMADQLTSCGIKYERQKILPVYFKGRQLEGNYRLDFLIEDILVVELKAMETVPSVCYSQLLTYMRLLQQPLGLLINFNVSYLTDGVQRISDEHRYLQN